MASVLGHREESRSVEFDLSVGTACVAAGPSCVPYRLLPLCAARKGANGNHFLDCSIQTALDRIHSSRPVPDGIPRYTGDAHGEKGISAQTVLMPNAGAV